MQEKNYDDLFSWADKNPELNLVGSILHNPENVNRAIEAKVSENYFFDPIAKNIWSVIEQCHRENLETNFVNVGTRIEIENRAEFAVASLHFPMTTDFEFHLKQFLEQSAKKQATAAVEKVGPDPVERSRVVQETIQNVMDGLKPHQSIYEVAEQWIDYKEQVIAGTDQGCKTHIPQLNELFPRGFAPGSLNVVAARPGLGKTTLALCFANHIAKSERTIFATIEMPNVEIMDRLISLNSRVPYSWTDYSEIQRDLIMDANREIVKKRKIEVWDDWRGRWDILASKLQRTVKEKKPPKFIVIDHLALMKFDSKVRDQVTNLSEITGSIKRFAQTHKVAILLLSQMNRSIEQEKGRPPRLADLRGSGTIEQDADSVLFICKQGADEDLFLVIAKNRHGRAHEQIPLRANYGISLMEGADFD